MSRSGQKFVSRLARDGFFVAPLGVANTEVAFLFAVVDLDLPVVEVGLDQFGGGGFEVGGEQIGFLPVMDGAVFVVSIGGGRADE